MLTKSIAEPSSCEVRAGNGKLEETKQERPLDLIDSVDETVNRIDNLLKLFRVVHLELGTGIKESSKSADYAADYAESLFSHLGPLLYFISDEYRTQSISGRRKQETLINRPARRLKPSGRPHHRMEIFGNGKFSSSK